MRQQRLYRARSVTREDDVVVRVQHPSTVPSLRNSDHRKEDHCAPQDGESDLRFSLAIGAHRSISLSHLCPPTTSLVTRWCRRVTIPHSSIVLTLIVYASNFGACLASCCCFVGGPASRLDHSHSAGIRTLTSGFLSSILHQFRYEPRSSYATGGSAMTLTLAIKHNCHPTRPSVYHKCECNKGPSDRNLPR